MSSLSLALELQLEGRDVSSALQGAQQQLQQLQQLTSELREKLVLAEQQQEQLQQQREAAAAAAAAELRTTNDQLERALLCQICFEKPKDTVLMPCMHFLYCSGCLAAAKTPGKKAAGGAAGGSKGDGGAVLKCPVCRVPCSGQLVVHLSPV
jgi:TolA-binding protein